MLSPIMSTTLHSPRLSLDDITCSTPFVTAPSTPCHVTHSGYFFSAPTSPTHFHTASKSESHNDYGPVFLSSDSGSFEFEFSSRFSKTNDISSMTSADELFFNGQIRPMKLSSHLKNPQEDQDLECLNVRGRDFSTSLRHRKARSMSPFRTIDNWNQTQTTTNDDVKEEPESIDTTPSCSASSSRSSSYSSGRNSKKWIFLKDLLHRSKSEGRTNTTTTNNNNNNNSKERFWSISFAPKIGSPVVSRGKEKKVSGGKPTNGLGKRRGPVSAHELHYTTNRAQAEEMKKKTFLPYRQGLFGCLGFSSKSYGAFSGFTKNFNPISSR